MFKLKEYILEIEKTGSFSQAAANLYVSQPSLSASVKRLEEKIGEPLFDRSTTPVSLTECGKEYVRAALMISQAEQNFMGYLEEYAGGQKGALTIGGSNLNLTVVIPPILKRYQNTYPGIKLELMEGNIDTLCEQLKEGRLDFVVDSCEMDPEQFAEYVYQPEHLILAVPSVFSCNKKLGAYRLQWEDILANRHLDDAVLAVPLLEFDEIPFLLMKPETDTGKRTASICKNSGFVPKGVLSFQQHSTMFHMACAGMGAAFVTDVMIENVYSKPELFYYKVGGQECCRNIRFYKKRDKRMNYAMQAFLKEAGIQWD